MGRHLRILVLVLLVAACANPPSAGRPVGTPAPPSVACLDDLARTRCDGAAQAAIEAVAPSGWTPTQIWIATGFFCPNENCLFDPNQNFPMPEAPSGGQWVANAEIAFAETDKQAGLHIATVAGALVPVLIGYRVPLLTWCSGNCPSAAATDGNYKLELTLPHLTWKSSDTISGSADLALTDSIATTIYGSGAGLIVFAFDEVGGTRHSGWAMTADCRSLALDPATPLNVALFKSGGVTDSGSAGDFQRSFFADSRIRLPAGTWDITAVATFSDGALCSGQNHTINATLRIIVGG